MVLMFMGVVMVVVKVLFQLVGKFMGNVICVFMFNVFLVVFNLSLKKGIIVEELNVVLCEVVLYGELVE